MEDYSKLPSAIERAKEEEKLKRAREDAEKLAAAQVKRAMCFEREVATCLDRDTTRSSRMPRVLVKSLRFSKDIFVRV